MTIAGTAHPSFEKERAESIQPRQERRRSTGQSDDVSWKRTHGSIWNRYKDNEQFWQNNTDTLDFPLLGYGSFVPDIASFKERKSKEGLGTLVVFFSTVLYCMASVLVKMNSTLPAVEINTIRSASSCVLASLLCIFVYRISFLPFSSGRRVVVLLIVRGFADVGAGLLFYVGCQQLGLGLAFVIMLTNPFWTAIMAKAFLGDPYTIVDFSAAVIAFIGISIFATPSILASMQGTGGVSLLMVAAVFPCSICQALTFIMTKYIKSVGDFEPMHVPVAYGICGMLIGPAAMAWGEKEKVEVAEPAPLPALYDPAVLGMAVGVALVAMTAQTTLAKGIELGCAPAKAALVRTLDIPLSLLFSWVIFGIVAQPLEMLGGGIVTVACCIPTLAKQHQQNMSQAAPGQEPLLDKEEQAH